MFEKLFVRHLVGGKRSCASLVEVAIGDKVLIAKFGGTDIKLDGHEYRMVDADDVIGII